MNFYPSDTDNGDDLPLSKTRKKKQAAALQKLGEELSQLSVTQLKLLALDTDLFKALVAARSITSNVAARRHRQYIGTLMRQVDPDPILEKLEQLKAAPVGLYTPKADSDLQLEEECQAVLDKLLTWDDACFESILSGSPDIDRQQLRQLIRNANKDIPSKNKASKALSALKTIIQKNVPPDAAQ